MKKASRECFWFVLSKKYCQASYESRFFVRLQLFWKFWLSSSAVHEVAWMRRGNSDDDNDNDDKGRW